MNIKNIVSIYFSPNGSTEKLVRKVSQAIGDYHIEKINLNTVESRRKKRKFKSNELVVFGMPVYADRLPSIAKDIFENIKGDNTPCVIIASYGNRDYGDALLELKDNLVKRGFKMLSGAAMVGEHCLNTNVASNRPDGKDEANIKAYGEKISEKLSSIRDIDHITDINVRGKFPYHPLKAQHTPQGDDKCIQCGICEKNCPVDAINENDYRITDTNKCIFCGRCIQVCPTNARDVRDKSFLEFMKKLETIAGERKEIEKFF